MCLEPQFRLNVSAERLQNPLPEVSQYLILKSSLKFAFFQVLHFVQRLTAILQRQECERKPETKPFCTMEMAHFWQVQFYTILDQHKPQEFPEKLLNTTFSMAL